MSAEPVPVAQVQRMGSYQGVPALGCLLSIEAEKRLKVNDPLYDRATLDAAVAAARAPIDEALIGAGLDCIGSDESVSSALQRLLSWERQIALDPAVSSGAAELVAAAQAEERAAWQQDAERYRWLRERYDTLCRMEPARALGLDLSRVYVNTADKFDGVLDAAISDLKPD